MATRQPSDGKLQLPASPAKQEGLTETRCRKTTGPGTPRGGRWSSGTSVPGNYSSQNAPRIPPPRKPRAGRLHLPASRGPQPSLSINPMGTPSSPPRPNDTRKSPPSPDLSSGNPSAGPGLPRNRPPSGSDTAAAGGHAHPLRVRHRPPLWHGPGPGQPPPHMPRKLLRAAFS